MIRPPSRMSARTVEHQVKREGIGFRQRRQCLRVSSSAGPQHADGGIAHHNVNVVEMLAKDAKGFSDTDGIADVNLNRQGVSAMRTNRGAHGLGLLVAVVISARHVATGCREIQRDGPADASGGASDEGDLSGEWFIHNFADGPVIAVRL
jgi:hypothetical protein